jgi:hypothetical protein
MNDDTLKCFEFKDGEIHYIVARDADEARDMYIEECNDEPDSLLDATIKEVSRELMSKIKVKMTLADMFDDCDAPCVLASTVD